MAVATNVTLSKSQFADKSPYPVAPGDILSFTFNITDIGGIANDANLNTKIFLGDQDTDLSSSLLTGSTTASGSDTLISSKTLGGSLAAGNDYTLAVYGTADGQVRLCGKIVLQCRQDGSKQ